MKIAFEGQEIGNMKQLEAGKGVAIEEGKINVALPVEVLSADEYAALPEEEKRSETLYGVPEPPWTPLPESLSVQDYKTEDGWHVRKWSDGYVEMRYANRKVYTNYGVSIQGVLWAKRDVAKNIPFPVKLVEKYLESGNISTFSASNTALLLTEGDDTEFYLDKTQNYRAMAFGSAISKGQDLLVEILVAGRWK